MVQVNIQQSASGVRWCNLPLKWNTRVSPHARPHLWVKLLNQLSPFSYEEALLLCQASEFEWIAWVPDHGEVTLHESQFCLMN